MGRSGIISTNRVADQLTTRSQSARFLLLYGLAWGGGAVAFVPFLTILLPLRVALLAPKGMEVAWLAYIAFAGAIAASISNIAFGYLSDITQSRRAWIWGGMVLSSGLLLAISTADDLAALVVLVVLWQFALNMMLAPACRMGRGSYSRFTKGLAGRASCFRAGSGRPFWRTGDLSWNGITSNAPRACRYHCCLLRHAGAGF